MKLKLDDSRKGVRLNSSVSGLTMQVQAPIISCSVSEGNTNEFWSFVVGMFGALALFEHETANAAVTINSINIRGAFFICLSP